MRVNGKGFGKREKVYGIAVAVALLLAVGTLPVNADTPDVLVRRIDQSLSAAQRRIPTDSTRAEQDLLEARNLLEQLDKAAPGHARRTALQQRSAQLGAQLERRLGRLVGGEPPAAAPVPAVAPSVAAPSALPSAVAQQFQRINNTLDGAETALGQDQLQSAATRLAQAEKMMQEVQSRHGSRIPAGDPEAKATTDRLAGVKARYEQARAAADAVAADAAGAEAQRVTLSREWIDRLSPFSDFRSGLYLAFGSTFNTASPEQQAVFHAAYARAAEVMEAYGNVDFPQGRTSELEDMAKSLSRLLASYQEEAGRTRVEEACRSWVERMRAYVEVGAGSRKYLLDGIVLNEVDIQARAALLEEAGTFWAEYIKADLPLGKTDQLRDLEETLRQRLETMPVALQRSRELMSADVEKEFDRILADLEADTGWKRDPAKLPNLVMARDVDGLRLAMERYAATVPAGDAKLVALRGKLDRILERDRDNRAVRAQRTFMRAERYTGADAAALRQRVESIVKERTGDLAVLRVSLSAEGWREESVHEWTDSTRSQRRHRYTRSMIAQAAGRNADGKVHLHTVHLASDRLASGEWGPLYGHVQWSEWMIEANVNVTP